MPLAKKFCDGATASISPAPAELTYKSSATLTAALDTNIVGVASVAWSSGNAAVAAVDENGKVYAAGRGSAVVTDKTVSKVQFINRNDSGTLTYDRNNPAVISLVEDGDNLIWTIQRVFTRAEFVFDVAVKVESIWYTTERVFALTVT